MICLLIGAVVIVGVVTIAGDGDEVVVEIDGLGRLHNTVRSAHKLAGVPATPSSGAQLSGAVLGPTAKRARL